MKRCGHCGWHRVDHETGWFGACSDYEPVETFTGPDEPVVELRLAQALRLIRDTNPGYASNTAARALVETGIRDPEEDCDVF